MFFVIRHAWAVAVAALLMIGASAPAGAELQRESCEEISITGADTRWGDFVEARSTVPAAELFNARGHYRLYADLSYAAYALANHELCARRKNNLDRMAGYQLDDLVASGLQPLEYGDFASYKGFDALRPKLSKDDFRRRGLFNGIYVDGNAAVLLMRSADALFIAFRGTNDRHGTDSLVENRSPDTKSWLDMEEHYSHFADLTPLLAAYVADSSKGISSIYVTGHSLGGAMAQIFIQRSASRLVLVEGTTFASPGFKRESFDPEPSVHNFWIAGDALELFVDLRYHIGSRFRIGGRIQAGQEDRATQIHMPWNYVCLASLLDETGVRRNHLSEMASKQYTTEIFSSLVIRQSYEQDVYCDDFFQRYAFDYTLRGTNRRDVFILPEGASLKSKGGGDRVYFTGSPARGSFDLNGSRADFYISDGGYFVENIKNGSTLTLPKEWGLPAGDITDKIRICVGGRCRGPVQPSFELNFWGGNCWRVKLCDFVSLQYPMSSLTYFSATSEEGFSSTGFRVYGE
jgi:hypothetical protein